MTLNPFKWFRDRPTKRKILDAIYAIRADAQKISDVQRDLRTGLNDLWRRTQSRYEAIESYLKVINEKENQIMATEGDNQQLLGIINAELSELVNRQKPPVATQANIDEDNAVLTAIQAKLKALLEPPT